MSANLSYTSADQHKIVSDTSLLQSVSLIINIFLCKISLFILLFFYKATVFGDPHIITFDDLEYTFNGKGEFALVHANSKRQKIDVQARFEQMPENIYGEVRATHLTAIAGEFMKHYNRY
jgi:hypothetical protein